MKRFLFITLFTAAFVSPSLYAQEGAKLTIPATPAFSVLDFEPSAIMRPTTAKALSSDILNSFGNDGKLLMNLGFEVSPYWLTSHPDLKRETYLNPKFGQRILQSLSLSAATVKDSVSGNNKFGAGLRFKLYDGKPLTDELNEASAEMKTKTAVITIISSAQSVVGTGGINTRQKAIDVIVQDLTSQSIAPKIVKDVKKQAIALQDDYTDEPASIKLFLNALIAARADAYKTLQKKISELLYQRKGFIVEMAAASAYSSAKSAGMERLGVWGNVSYTLSSDDYLTLTSRYLFKSSDTTTANFDMGLGFLKKTGNYNISVEAMLRHNTTKIPMPISRTEKDFSYRLAVQGSFKVTDNINLNLSIGKDFDSPLVAKTNFFSIIGFNYSIFSKEIPKD